MKIILGLLGATLIGGSTLSLFTSTLKQEFEYKEVSSLESVDVDWSDVQFETQNIFDNILENYSNSYEIKNFSFLGNDAHETIDEEILKEMIYFASEESNNLLKNFNEKKLNLNEAIEVISSNSADFKYNFSNFSNELMAELESENLDLLNNSNNYNSLLRSSISQERAKNNKLVSDLRLSRKILATGSAAAIAAAGFCAASWWLGISTPWAIGCTLASSALSVAASGLSLAIIKYDKDMKAWEQFGTALTATINIGSFLARTSYTVLIKMNIVVSGTTWCFPTAVAILASCLVITQWISRSYIW